MSTRANIIIKDHHEQLFFYRHSDGYPEGTMPTLNIFLNWLKAGKIRNNVPQSAGWLTIIGAIEYGTLPTYNLQKERYEGARKYADMATISDPDDWKASSYEPTTGVHEDIEYLYIIDLIAKTVKCYEEWTDEGKGLKEVDLTIKG